MKVTLERTALLKSLGHVHRVVERRNTIPILSNVLLSAEGGGVAFSATDLDMEIVDETSAQVGTPGQITAPAHTLYEIVRKLPDGAEVELRCAGEDPRLQVAAGRSRFNLPVLPAGDFPIMSSDGLSTQVTLGADELARLIDFRTHNLMEPRWQLADPFDIVFCRNVMIYFDGPTQRKVLERIHGTMKPRGLLFVGHSENFTDSKDLFRLRGKTVYERV